MTAEQLTAWTDRANEVAIAGRETGHPFLHPLQEIECRTYSQSVRSEAEIALQSFSEKISKCLRLIQDMKTQSQAEWDDSRPEQFSVLVEICRQIDQCDYIPPSLFMADDIKTSCSRIREAAGNGEREQAIRGELLVDFSDRICTFDAKAVHNEWQRLSLQWFLPRWLGQRRIIKLLRQFATDTSWNIESAQVPELLHRIETYHAEKQQLTDHKEAMMSLLGSLWNGFDTDWEKVRKACETAERLSGLISGITANRQDVKKVTTNLSPIVAQQQSKQIWTNFISAYTQWEQSAERVASLLSIDFRKLISPPGNWLVYLAEKAVTWSEHLEGLRAWSTWLVTKDAALQAGLDPLIVAYEQGKLQSDQVVPAYYKAIYKSAASYIIANKPELSHFSGTLFEDKIRRFQETSERFEQLTKQEIFSRLAAKLPDFTREASQNSELGILQKAIRSNARSLSLRKLFEQIPNLLVRLCPCMLMSPISVAQYLDPKTALFDLVVFDEASQMPTCEAVGAIARGKEVIVVGDPRQLPPTSFFTSNLVEDDDFVTEDLESILDDCLALSMPEEHLMWHYRSKHESLISFSNMQYYDNKLMTFPSPNDLTSKVTLIPVEGYYDRGKTKQNKAEAAAVVDEILKRLQDPELSKLSIGVVTFSSIQQNLIDDLLSDAFRANPELEDIALQSDEPIFIKNLENVQGDERDVILFSIGYGPDENGKVSLNFGPLNREGGWRRLNVAVSRARYEMMVFSTLKPEQIDIARTRAEGIAGLKAFLEYAQKGKNNFAIKESGMLTRFDAGISEQVVDALQAAGYTAHVNVGCSGYKIDVAVLSPDKQDEYILGILCDGFSCKNAQTASDRDLLQRKVLRQLGWSVLSIRAVDWWENPAREIQKIIQAINDHKHPKRKPETEPVVNTQLGSFCAVVPRAYKEQISEVAATMEKTAVPYIATKFPSENMTPEEFCLPESTPKVLQRIQSLIEVEAPISRVYLLKRILQSYGISRAGARLERRFDELLRKVDLIITGGEKIKFIWKSGSVPGSYAVFRIPGNDTERRNPEDIAPEEIAVAVKYVLESQISMPKQELVKETSKVLGFLRTGPAIEAAMSSGIDMAIQRKWAVQGNDERVVLNSAG